MEPDKECMYCARDERVTNLMIEICTLGVSTLYLFREQTHRGRCTVALNRHERELFLLSAEERAAFMNDVARAARAISRAFGPDKINYAAFGDKVPHIHMHLVPKYAGGESWGSTFEMNPGKVYLTDGEYTGMIKAVTDNL